MARKKSKAVASKKSNKKNSKVLDEQNDIAIEETETIQAEEGEELELSAEVLEESDLAAAEKEVIEAAEGSFEGSSQEEVALESSHEDEESLEMSEQDEDGESELEANLEGTELAGFDSAEIEDIEKIEEEQLDSIVESLLFASDKPITIATIKASFKGTNIRSEHIRKSIQRLQLELQGGRRGVSLEEVRSGYQIRTKHENMKFLTRSVKPKAFRLSGPALEVLAIVAYKQPTVKSEIDDIRGVESGHLLRALMEKGLVGFEGKSELPGKPMQYGTSQKFLEIFGLRNLKELPTLSQIDELLPEGIGDEADAEKEVLSDLTGKLSQEVAGHYSEGEEELQQISDQLQDITTTSDFFEDEKAAAKRAKDEEKARTIREALMDAEREASVSKRDRNWLERFDLAQADQLTGKTNVQDASAEGVGDSSGELEDLAFEGEQDEEASQNEISEGRFTEEEDISLDSDLNVDLHDSEEPDPSVET